MTTTTKTLESYVIRREGDLPLRFRGRIIGCAEEKENDNGVIHAVELYRTAKGAIIAAEFFDANFLREPKRKAERFNTAKEAIAWLRDERHGTLGSVHNSALIRATRQDAEFLAAYGEDV